LSILNSDVGKELEPYDLFIFIINAEQTREKYITRMRWNLLTKEEENITGGYV